MARKSIVARQIKREKLVAKFEEKRKQLKAEGDYLALDKLPKNSSKVRLRNRCSITGRGKGYIGAFGVSRIKFRELASLGRIPGVTKASW